MISVRKRPCPTCPYRRDVPSGIWHESEYSKLRSYDGDVPDQLASSATALFYCHQRDGNLCAGWVGCHDMTNNLAVRFQQADVDPAVYDYESPVPLFGSGAEAAEHGLRDLAAPGPAAMQKMRRIQTARATRVAEGEK